jgi:excisionase family DNA binding protein
VQSNGSAANEQLATNNFVFEPLLTDEQAATLLGIHHKTLQRLARNEQIPAHHIGRFWRYRASELDAWLRTAVSSGSQSARVNEEN